MLLLLLVLSTKKVQRMVLNVRTFKKSDNVIIRWKSSKSKAPQAAHAKVQVPVAVQKKKQVSVPKVAPKPINLSGKFTPINLGPIKKRKITSSYQVPQPPPKALEPRPELLPEPIKQTAPAVPQEPLVISVQEYNEQQATFEIVESVRRWWQPPMGVRPDAECIIMITVTDSGVCGDIIVQQSSGIPAYDISAKSALLKCNLPKTAWGKQCVLKF
jgi:hypothetical protein